jgi:hypothetical protein
MGAPPADATYLGVLVAGSPGLFETDRGYGNHEVASLVLKALAGSGT